MTTSIGSVTAQLFDKLSDLVVGPVQGMVVATSTSGTVILPQGTYGVLSDGRLVRVRRSTRVTTTATFVPCRLAFLTPSYPAPSNFAAISQSTTTTSITAIAAVTVSVVSTVGFPASGTFYLGSELVAYTGTTAMSFTGCSGIAAAYASGSAVLAGPVVTWQSPPAGVNASGRAVSFGSGSLSSGLRCQAMAVCEAPTEAMTEVFGAGASGDVFGCLYAPRLRRKDGLGGEHTQRRLTFEATWRLRVMFSQLGPQKDNATLSQMFFDGLTSSLLGARVGSGNARIDGWEPVRRTADDGRVLYEASIIANLWSEGRVIVQPDGLGGSDLDPFTILGIEIRGEGYGDQAPSFVVEEDISVA